MNGTLSQELANIRLKAIDYITSVLEKRGSDYELCDPDWYDYDEIDDNIYNMPRGYAVSKHGFYTEYPIVMANINDGKVTLTGVNIMDENGGDDMEFEVDMLHTDVLCSIADLMWGLEN